MGAAARAHVDAFRDVGSDRERLRAGDRTDPRLVRDPAHKALAIWGKSLVDLGADATDLREGLGVGYARALATFRGTS